MDIFVFISANSALLLRYRNGGGQEHMNIWLEHGQMLKPLQAVTSA